MFKATRLVLEILWFSIGGLRIKKILRFIADLTGNEAGDMLSMTSLSSFMMLVGCEESPFPGG